MGIGNFAWTSHVTLLALLVYLWNTIEVGRARGKYGVSAPAVTGAPEFERAFRIQQNMVEQLVLFLPLLWLCAASLADIWAAVIGLVWVVGRVLYAFGYAQAPEKRGAGFGISMLACLALLLGVIVGWFV